MPFSLLRGANIIHEVPKKTYFVVDFPALNYTPIHFLEKWCGLSSNMKIKASSQTDLCLLSFQSQLSTTKPAAFELTSLTSVKSTC